jgi:hypothetical protein
MITVTSSLNEISRDQLGNRVAVRRGGIIPPAPIPFLQQASGIRIDMQRRRERFSLFLGSRLQVAASYVRFYEQFCTSRQNLVVWDWETLHKVDKRHVRRNVQEHS